MKTAISIPDELFAEADRLARRLQVSRSELYSRAVREFVARHDPDGVTEALDRFVAETGLAREEFVATASRRVLDATEW